MTQDLITNWNQKRKIAFYKPLKGVHSVYGKLEVHAAGSACFYIKSEAKSLKSSTFSNDIELLDFSFSDGDHFSFQGQLKLDASKSCFVFSFNKEGYQALFSKLLIKLRKNQHIEVCLQENVESSDRFTGFSRLHFVPKALPEMNHSDLDLSTQLFGRRFSYPFFITGMTGGVEEGQRINENLAENAVRFNIPMGLGSQRMALEHPEYESVFTLKDKFPDLFLIANLGFSDLLKEEDPVAYCQRAVDMVKANVLAIHLNALQECVQTEGNKDFKGFYSVLRRICMNLSVPVMIKEVGVGVGPEVAKTLQELGVASLDVGGRGGTSWSQVESFRSLPSESRLGQTFRDTGIPTAYSLAASKRACPDFEVTATGGFRNGLMVAKAVALGASSCGLGLPLFKAAVVSSDSVANELMLFLRELETVMLITGSCQLSELQKHLVHGHPLEGEFEKYLQEIGVMHES